MGTESRSFTVVATVSRHNSVRDEQDDARFDELQERVGQLCQEYEDITAWIV